MSNPLYALLEREYGIHTLSMREQPGGWCAAAYRLETGEGVYFLKAYDKHRPSVRDWIARMDDTIPVVLWLQRDSTLREHMVCPVLTRAGAYKAEDVGCVYLLFPYIEGDTIGEERLTAAQIRELAQIVAALHQYDGRISVPTSGIAEAFDTSFCEKTVEWLSQGNLQDSLLARNPSLDVVKRAAACLEADAEALRRNPPAVCLCHTDLHGWNLMQADKLILIDWEGLSLAPVEADLFAFTRGYFFEDAWDEFLDAYRERSPAYRVDGRAMRYYQIRRRLTDIYESLDSMLHDGLSRDGLRQTGKSLLAECRQLEIFLEQH